MMDSQVEQQHEAGKIKGYNWAADEVDLPSFNAHRFYSENLASTERTWLDYLREPSGLTAAQKLYGVFEVGEDPKPAEVPNQDTRDFWKEVCGDDNPDLDFVAGFAAGTVELFNSRVGASSEWLELESSEAKQAEQERRLIEFRYLEDKDVVVLSGWHDDAAALKRWTGALLMWLFENRIGEKGCVPTESRQAFAMVINASRDRLPELNAAWDTISAA